MRAVLVADDNLTVQRIASEMLSEAGLEVVTVANGMAAIKKLADVKPLVVLADTDMPGKDGYEVCDFVKKQPGLGYIRVLLAVSDGDPLDAARATEAGVDGVIKKPFDRDTLIATIVRCVDEAEGLCPEPIPPPTAPDPCHSPSDSLATEAAPHPDDEHASEATGFQGAFAVPDPQEFEVVETSGPPIVDWPDSAVAEVQLEPPTPVADCYFDPAAAVVEREPAPAQSSETDVAVPALELAPVTNEQPPLLTPTEPASPVGHEPPSDSDKAEPLGSDPQPPIADWHFAETPSEPEAPQPPRHPTETAGPVDPSVITAIVKHVVARLAPPALSEEAVEKLEFVLTQEVLRDVKPSRTH